jgi:hypothetical protein
MYIRSIYPEGLHINWRHSLAHAVSRKAANLYSSKSRGRGRSRSAVFDCSAQPASRAYWLIWLMLPSHWVPAALVIRTTLGTSHGPRQPLIVRWTRFTNPRCLHSFFNHSTGTAGCPLWTWPQQQPLQTLICPSMGHLVESAQGFRRPAAGLDILANDISLSLI